MKKIYLLTLVFVTILSTTAFAQEETNDDPQDTTKTNLDLSYNKGDVLAQAGISLGYYGYGYSGSRTGFTLPITASLEYGISDKISAGPYAGFARWSYKYYDYKYSWTFISLGARGSFHYTQFFNEIFDTDLDESKYDLYVTVIAGIEIRNFSSSDDFFTDYYDNDVTGVFGPMLGFRYYFNPSFSAFFEGGRGAFGYGNFGVSMKF
jgi:hypothetical protein